MHLMTDAARRCWRRIRDGASGGTGRFLRSRHQVPVLIGVLAVAGTVAGVLVATVGGRPAAGPGSSPVVPATRPAPGRSASPVVPILGGSAGTGDSSFAVPAARLSAGPDHGSSGSAK